MLSGTFLPISIVCKDTATMLEQVFELSTILDPDQDALIKMCEAVSHDYFGKRECLLKAKDCKVAGMILQALEELLIYIDGLYRQEQSLHLDILAFLENVKVYKDYFKPGIMKEYFNKVYLQGDHPIIQRSGVFDPIIEKNTFMNFMNAKPVTTIDMGYFYF